MDRHGIDYHRIDNAFARIEDLTRAQRFASRLAHKNWPRILESFARRINPLTHYFELGKAACQRYVQALADMEDPRQAYQQVHRLTQPCTRQGHSVRGINPLRRDDALLFEAVVEVSGEDSTITG